MASQHVNASSIVGWETKWKFRITSSPTYYGYLKYVPYGVLCTC